MYRPPNLTDEQWLAFKTAAAQPDRTWALEIAMELNDGTHLDLYENDIVANSLVFKEQSTCSDGIMVGSTFANSLDFSLMNPDGLYRQYDFINATVTPTVKMYVPQIDTWAEIKLGTFIVQSAGKKYTTIPFQCMDLMCRFNRPLSKTEPIFPMSLRLLFQKACTVAGVTYTSDLYNQIPELTVNEFDAEKCTCRDFLAHLGCLIGKNLRMSRTNQLEAFWYTDTQYTTTPNTRTGITLNDLDVHPTAVSVKDWNGKEYVPEDADTSYLIAFETNPLIQNDEIAVSVLAALNARLTAVRYQTYDCQFIGDPTVQAGDTVIHNVVIDEQQVNDSVESLIMSHEYRFRGLGKIAALGKTAEQDRQLSAEAKKILDVQMQAAKDLNEGLNFTQQAILNQSNLLTESLALYPGIKYDVQGRIIGYYMASEPIFPDNRVILPDDSNVDPREDCYVWKYGAGGIGVSDTGYFGAYSGFSKDKSIIARTITADWIRTGVLSAIDNTLQIDLESGRQIIQATEGWGQTVLDGIGAMFKYWNKNVTSAETDGHPPLAYLLITADADEMASTESQIAADLKLVWETYDGKKRTSIGHTLVHATNGSGVESFHPFEIKSDDPIHVAPGLYYDESLLFDNIVMRRTNTVKGNTGVDFLIVPNAIPVIPIPDGQVNLMTNPGFEQNGLSPWTLYSGNWAQTSSAGYVHSGNYAAQCPDQSANTMYLPSDAVAQLGLYNHSVYIGFWLKATGNNTSGNYALCLRSGETPASSSTTHIQTVSDGSDWIYVSAIVPALQNGWVLSLYSSSYYGYAIDDFYVYDAQGYSIEQWDDYVARGAN